MPVAHNGPGIIPGGILENAAYGDEMTRHAGDLDKLKKAVRGETLL
jgi:hypothetical protein